MITRAYRRPGRVLALLTLVAPLAGTVVLSTAAPALAAPSVGWVDPTPSSGAVITGGTSVPVKASIGSGTRPQIQMVINPPGGLSPRTTTLAACTQTITHSCPGATMSDSYPLTSNGAPVPNGSWSVQLTGTTLSDRTFFTNVAPTSAPTNLTAKGTGASRIDLTWQYDGAETDGAGFLISDDHGNTYTAGASDRSYTAYYSNPDPGTYPYQFTVKALRNGGGCGSCGSTVAGPASSTASAQLVTPQPPPPPPSPTPGPTGGSTGGTTGGTTGGSTTGGSTTGGSTTGGSTTGGSTSGGSTTGTQSGSTTGTKAKPIVIPTLPPIVASRRAFALGFNKFSPSLGIPKLPPLPATTFPQTAPAEGYQPALPYAKQAESKKSTSVLSSPIAAVSSIDTATLAKDLAVALLLLACAAHVRLFLSRQDED